MGSYRGGVWNSPPLPRKLENLYSLCVCICCKLMHDAVAVPYKLLPLPTKNSCMKCCDVLQMSQEGLEGPQPLSLELRRRYDVIQYLVDLLPYIWSTVHYIQYVVFVWWLCCLESQVCSIDSISSSLHGNSS